MRVQQDKPLGVYLRLMGLWGLGTMRQRLGWWEGASLPPPARCLCGHHSRSAYAGWLSSLWHFSTLKFLSIHHPGCVGWVEIQIRITVLMETKPRVILLLCSQVGWKFLSDFFKALDKVTQNKLPSIFWTLVELSSSPHFARWLSQTRAHFEPMLLLSRGGMFSFPI